MFRRSFVLNGFICSDVICYVCRVDEVVCGCPDKLGCLYNFYIKRVYVLTCKFLLHMLAFNM